MSDFSQLHVGFLVPIALCIVMLLSGIVAFHQGGQLEHLKQKVITRDQLIKGFEQSVNATATDRTCIQGGIYVSRCCHQIEAVLRAGDTVPLCHKGDHSVKWDLRHAAKSNRILL